MTTNSQNSLRHIFLADDDEDDRMLFSEALSEVDGSVLLTEAENGKDLMNKLYLPPNPLPEIVFLDINMPLQNGFQCLEEIRKDAKDLKNLNVIMFSTSNNEQSIETAFGLGATHYAVKPNSFGALKSLIASVLKMDGSYPYLMSNKNRSL